MFLSQCFERLRELRTKFLRFVYKFTSRQIRAWANQSKNVIELAFHNYFIQTKKSLEILVKMSFARKFLSTLTQRKMSTSTTEIKTPFTIGKHLNLAYFSSKTLKIWFFPPLSCRRQYWCWKNHIFEKFRQIFKISWSDTWTCTKMARCQGTQFVGKILSRTKTMVNASTDLCSTDNGSKS